MSRNCSRTLLVLICLLRSKNNLEYPRNTENDVATTEWKEVPAAQVSCGAAFTHAVPKASWLTTSCNYWGKGHQPTMGEESSVNNGYEGHQPTMGMRLLNKIWVGGHHSTMGMRVISQLWIEGSTVNYMWKGHQPTMGGGGGGTIM